MWTYNTKQLIALGAAVVVLLIFTIVMIYRPNRNSTGDDSIQIIEPTSVAESNAVLPDDQPVIPLEPQTICVHVAGKVKAPGMYNLQPDCRVIDAIKAAGGALQNADLESINLAQKLSDGVQVYISPKGKVPPPVKSVVRGASSAVKGDIKTADNTGSQSESEGISKLTTPGQGTVNINTADLDELQRLPGIGPSMAQRIVDYRNEHGRFASIDELDEVKGIGSAKLEKMRPFVTL